MQYCRTVSMAHFLSASQRIRAEPVLSLSCGHQPCHRYTSWKLSTRNRAARGGGVVAWSDWVNPTQSQNFEELHVFVFVFLPGCSALYKSSWRKGRELTRSGALDGWNDSLAINSPDVLHSWKSLGVKLNFPGSEKNKKNQIISGWLWPEFSSARWIIDSQCKHVIFMNNLIVQFHNFLCDFVCFVGLFFATSENRQEKGDFFFLH